VPEVEYKSARCTYNEFRSTEITNLKVKGTYSLNGDNKRTNRWLFRALALIDSIYNLHMFQEGSCDEPSLEDALLVKSRSVGTMQ
jgi:hypothetical protein